MSNPATTPVPAIALREVTKTFPGVRALDRVSLPIAAGSCHALVGENGAGKSTLGKLLAGLLAPDSGEIRVNGLTVRFHSPQDAMDAGIGMVHQELLFCENLTVAENICLADLPSRGPFVSRRRMAERARVFLDKLGAAIAPFDTVGDLPIGQRQLVQIAAAIARGAKLLILDEPTSSLSQADSDRLFALMQRLRQEGVTLIYVSHRLEEIFRVADTVTVLRDGQVVATRPVSEYTEDRLVQDMIGRPLAAYFPAHLEKTPGEELLRVQDLSSPGKFDGISFTLHAGEILGLAGLVGAGRTELAEAIFGLDSRAKGRVFARGKEVSIRHPRQAMARGLGLVPEDRKRHGLVLSMKARENISLPILERFSRMGWVRTRAERGLAARFFDTLRVRAPHMDTPSASLSGGNQQKLILARWMGAACEVLLVDEPTRGVDVGAKAEIHALIDRLARDGAGILLISSELPEILNLSTRILVLRNGRLQAEVPRHKATQGDLLRLMAGIAA